MKGKIRRVFPGGNTSQGFYSYYDYLLEKGSNRIFVVKGGPGVGKSSLMKKIGNSLAELGYDLEFHHCSSDNNSLDGIAVLEVGVVMVDGTAPHIVDPKYPGGLDEIINMGEFWDIENMRANKDKIIASTTEVGRLFARAYRYLGAAKEIASNVIDTYKKAMDFCEVNKCTLSLEKELLENSDTYHFPQSQNMQGKERHLFGSALTPEGHIDYTGSILAGVEKVYYLAGEEGTGKTTLLQKVKTSAVTRGFEVEVFHTPLIPQKIETLIIEELNTAITTSPVYRVNNYKVIDLNKYMDQGMIAGLKAELNGDKELTESLINQGIDNIRKAKQEHDLLEKNYIPNMNFEKVEELYKELMTRILHFADQSVMAASTKKYN